MKAFLLAHKAEAGIFGAMLLVVLAVLAFAVTAWDDQFVVLTANGVSYPTATVEQVLSEDLSHEEGTSRYLGSQTLMVRIDSGPYQGETVEADNSLSATHNVLGRVGGRVVIKAERQDGVTPYYSVFNYDRTPGIVAILAVFAVSMVLVGGTKGLRSLLGLAFALFVIVAFLLPALYRGIPPIAAGLAAAAVITLFSMLLLNGWSRKTLASIASTIAGLAAAVAVYLAFTALLNVSGFNQESAEELIIVQQATGLDVQQILFVSVLISALGAVMDMCMSIATSLFEMKERHPEMTARQMVASGFSIGRDMIGTMCQTLILAFTGSSLTSLLVLISYGIDFNQLLSSDYMAIEFIHSFVGGIAVILCVPITSLICARACQAQSVSSAR